MDPKKLFDFIQIMFTNSKEFEKIRKEIKASHLFMIQRFMSIKFPSNANMFNQQGINAAEVINTWQNYAIKQGSIPNWIYTKTKKVQEEAIKKVWKPDPELVKYYINKMEISPTDYELILKYHKEKHYEELQEIERMMKTVAK